MNYAAILAGGIGKRVENYSIPKQFITIGGNPVITYTIRAFLQNENIDMIYVAVHRDWLDYAKKLFAETFSVKENEKLHIVPGGKERLDSFSNIIDDITENRGVSDEDTLICHDSVRPFVRQQMINDCVAETKKYGFALTVVPVADTIHVEHEDGMIDSTLDRQFLYNGQTPSGFNILKLKKLLCEFSEKEKEATTGTTQLVLKAGYKIKEVKGHTSNFKITTDNDIEIADRIIRSSKKRSEVKLLDCTLRDGGIVIDFNFGAEKMQQIKSCLERSGVDFIECGYIDEKKGTAEGRTCYDNEQSIKNTLLASGKKPGVKYVAMIDYGTFTFSNLQNADEKGIDGIRLAFHKEHWKEAIDVGRTIIEKGYELYIQPMVTMRYSDEEFRKLIAECNRELPEAKAFYIVDSFGQMDIMELLHRLEIADQYVSPDMMIGFHAHNNRQMAFSNACAFLKAFARHDLMLDSSIMGMGKGAGNLCTELIIPVLTAEGKQYFSNCIYDEISEYFSAVLKTNPWGYCLDYYLSSLYSCTPSYIKIFNKDERVTTDILIDLLKNMPDEKRAACDKVFAAKYLADFFTDK